jgi:hypothetical protein
LAAVTVAILAQGRTCIMRARNPFLIFFFLSSLFISILLMFL